MSPSHKQTFELFIDDDRYSVPTLHLIFAWNQAAAVEAAKGLLDDSDHHLGAELRQSGVKLAGLGSLSTRWPPRASTMTEGGGADA